MSGTFGQDIGFSSPPQSKRTRTTNDVNDKPQNTLPTTSEAAEHMEKHIWYQIVYWLVRYFVVLTSFGSAFLTSLYGLSNIINVEAVNFFCPIRTKEDVYEYNLNLNDTDGQDDGSCWTINRLKLDTNAVEDLNIHLYTADINISGQSIVNIMFFVICILLVLFLLGIAIQNLYFVIYDTIYFYCYKTQNPRIQNVHEKWREIITKQNIDTKNNNIKKTQPAKNVQGHSQKHNKRNCCETIYHSVCMVGCVWYSNTYRKYFYFDSKWKVLSMMGGEIIEILVQLYGLFLFGGIDLFNPNNIPLAQEANVVLSFSIIVGMNAILASIGWFVYVIFHDVWHGTLFFCLIFFIDTGFEILYTLFPLIYLTPGGRAFDARSLGILQKSNPFVILQVLYATMCLSRKLRNLMKKLDPSYIEECYYLNIHRIKLGTYESKEPWIITSQWLQYNADRQTQQRAYLQSSVSDTPDTPRTAQYHHSQNSSNDKTIAKVAQQPTNFQRPFVDKLHAMIRTEFKNPTQWNVDPDSTQKTLQLTSTPQLELSKVVSLSDSRSQAHGNDSCSATQHTITTLGLNDFIAPKSNNADLNNPAHDGAGESLSGLYGEQMNSEQMKIQRHRKMTVALLALVLAAFGIGIIIAFVSDIETNYNSKCVGDYHFNYDNYTDFSNTNKWHSKHPEIAVIYKQFCNRKAINIFSDYPCNCRQLKIHNSPDYDIDFSTVQAVIYTLPNAFVQWTMLEAFNFDAQNTDGFRLLPTLNLNDTKMNLKYLKIFNTNSIKIGAFSNNIDQQLKNLEIFRIRNSLAPLYLPWKSLTNIDSITAIHLQRIDMLMYPWANTIDMCKLKNLRYLQMLFFQMYDGSVLNIGDCIENSWTKLEYIYLGGSLNENDNETAYVSPTLYGLPNIRSIALIGWSFNISSFNNFSQYYTNHDYTKNLYDNGGSFVWFSTSGVCKTTTTGKTWLQYMSNNDSKLGEFIELFDPCFEPCGEIADGNGCNAFTWGDGSCDAPCFNQICQWDDGDCTQLCQCNATLLNNGKCDDSCNNKHCQWDNRDCRFGNGTCNTNVAGINETELCFDAWITEFDGWCDANCYNATSCDDGTDAGQCRTCTGNCAFVHTIFTIVTGSEGNHMVEQDVCDYWDEILDWVPSVTTNFTNCSQLFDFGDGNYNEKIGFYELIVVLARMDLLSWRENYEHELKLEQIDCSICIAPANLTMYYL